MSANDEDTQETTPLGAEAIEEATALRAKLEQFSLEGDCAAWR